MQFWCGSKRKPIAWLLPIMALTLVFAVACGSAAAPQPAAPEATQAEVKAQEVPTAAPQTMGKSDTPMEQPEAATGTATIMVGGWGGRFTLLHATNCHNYDVNFHGYMIRSDDDRAFIPGIASAWDISDDGLTWNFTVRDNAVFHDGEPVTADDVYFTWVQSWGPEALEVASSSSALNMSRNTEMIKRTAPDQVSITHKVVTSGFPGFVSDTSGACQGMVMPAHFWGGLNNLHDDDLTSQYDVNPVGAGPLTLSQHIPEELMAFEGFDDYYAEERNLKIAGIDLRKVPEEATRAAALRAGEADIAPVSGDTQAQVEGGGGRIVYGDEASYIYIKFLGGWDRQGDGTPLPDTPLVHKEVRQALHYALDLETFRTELWGTEVFVPKGWSHVTPSSLGYSAELDPFPYDPDKARELMAQAGYPNGDGFGALVLNTWTSRAVPFLPESAQIAADFWKKELGIEVEVRIGDETATKKAANTTDELYGQVLWRDNEARVDGASIMRSGYAQPDNVSRSHNSQALFDKTVETMAVIDPALRHQAWNELYKIAKDEAHRMAIGYINIPWGVGPNVLEWTPQPMAFYPSNLHTIVLAEQK
jgi:peptide/nickel transport system substrate-binding protein